MWVARDSSGHLWGFTIKPMRFPTTSPVAWTTISPGQSVLLFDDLLPELTWEDEPVEVVLVKKPYSKIIKKKCG